MEKKNRKLNNSGETTALEGAALSEKFGVSISSGMSLCLMKIIPMKNGLGGDPKGRFV